MRRILALVCIFILFLFTGMPMFTSNLLCNETRVYADTPDITDNEKIRQGITVFLNSKGAYLSSQGLQMDTVMFVMQQYVDLYFNTRDFAEEFYDQNQWLIDPAGELAKYIIVNYNPYQLALRPLSVRFFNAFLKWLIDNGYITNNQTNNELYNGGMIGGNLFYVFEAPNINYSKIVTTNIKAIGTPVDGCTSDVLLSQWRALSIVNGNFDFSDLSNTSRTFTSLSKNINFASDTTVSMSFTAQYGDNGESAYRPRFYYSGTSKGNPYPTDATDELSHFGKIIYQDVPHKTRGNPAYILISGNGQTKLWRGIVAHDYTTNKWYSFTISEVSNNTQYTPASVNFNKDDFDSTPTTPPTGSDGLTYQPKQDGTGNTYNTYNDYYQDWHEGDTYIYYPSDGGGGSGGDDPGGGGEDPTPGGTTPPWDGSDPSNPAGTLTPAEGGGYNFNLPDLGLPDLNIDWSINGLKDKFPFSIPWDLMAFFAVLNAEPETPELQATIPLGRYEWDIDWDLHAFDNIARILRNLELIGFCIGLIIITRSIIKG